MSPIRLQTSVFVDGTRQNGSQDHDDTSGPHCDVPRRSLLAGSGAVLGDSASPLKLILLVGACCLVLVAGYVRCAPIKQVVQILINQGEPT